MEDYSEGQKKKVLIAASLITPAHLYIWWGTIPMPVATFFESADFSGKTIDLIATHGGSGFASSASDIRKICPGADVREGISIYCEDIPDAHKQVEEYLNSIR